MTKRGKPLNKTQNLPFDGQMVRGSEVIAMRMRTSQEKMREDIASKALIILVGDFQTRI